MAQAERDDKAWVERAKRLAVAINEAHQKVWRITCTPEVQLEIGLTADKRAVRLSGIEEEGCTTSVVLSRAAFLALKDSVWDLDLQPQDEEEAARESAGEGA